MALFWLEVRFQHLTLESLSTIARIVLSGHVFVVFGFSTSGLSLLAVTVAVTWSGQSWVQRRERIGYAAALFLLISNVAVVAWNAVIVWNEHSIAVGLLGTLGAVPPVTTAILLHAGRRGHRPGVAVWSAGCREVRAMSRRLDRELDRTLRRASLVEALEETLSGLEEHKSTEHKSTLEKASPLDLIAQWLRSVVKS